MNCTATDCATCRNTEGCGWNGMACGISGNDFQEQCSTHHAGAMVTPTPPMDNNTAGMARLGSAGYVDPYFGMQNIPNDAITYGKYQKRFDIHMSGTNMQSCLPTLQYGDAVVLSNGDLNATLTGNDVNFIMGRRTTLLLRPPPGSDRLGDIRYGDSVVLTTTITESNSCGVYGCGVGSVINGQFFIGQGGTTGGTPFILDSPNGLTGGIVYGAAITLSARVSPQSTVLNNGQSLSPTESLESSNGRYQFVYESTGYVSVYNTDERQIWTSGKSHTPSKLKFKNGALVAYDVNGLPRWQQRVNGRGPYTLEVTDTGSVRILGKGIVLWATPADPQPDPPSENTVLSGSLIKNKLVFTSRVGTNFRFDTNPGKRCDVASVSKLCGDDCPGFLYSRDDATWQPLTSNKTDYRYADTLQQVWMKNVQINLGDASCPSGEAEMISDYGSPVGNLVKGKADQCAPPKSSTVLPAAYTAAAKRIKDAESELSDVIGKTQPVLTELRETRNKKKDPTADQQAADWVIVNREYKSRSYVWIFSAGVFVLVAIVIARQLKKN